MTALLFHGDTVRHPSLRHEVPLAIIDPLLLVLDGERTLIMTSMLESERIAQALPHAELALMDRLGFYELLEEGMLRDEAELEVTLRALRSWGIESALVPPDLAVAVADRLRAEGLSLTVDAGAFTDRRRSKTAPELEGIRRASRAAEAGLAAARALIHGAQRVGGLLEHDGASLTAEIVRGAVRAVCAEAGAPAPPDIMVVSKLSGGGHDPGSGPLPADAPIEVDLWPCDEATGCWADMTRTFVCGEVSDEVAVLREVVLHALESVRAAVRPGVTGRELYDIAAGIVEAAGHPTQRTRTPGETLTRGFYFGLGHGVGLEIHEPPGLGLSGGEELVEGDVIAIEPGIEGIPGIGGVRYEDLLLVTATGSETLTTFDYEL